MKARLLVCGLSLLAATMVHAGYTPVSIKASSYNADVIVESNATPRLVVVTSATIDNGTNNTGNTLFEQGYDTNNPGNGVPPHGSTFVSRDNANYSFTMAPTYAGNNGILFSAESPGGTFTLVNPAPYKVLSFLGLGGNGGDTATVTVTHQDGSTESGTFATSDWFGGTSEIAIIMGGRLNNVNNLVTETDGTSGDGLYNPRIYHHEITLSNTTSPVTKVQFTYLSGNSGSHSDVMAMSGGASTNGPISPIAVTGYNEDFICESNAPHGGRILSQTVIDNTNVFATSESLDTTGNTGNSWYEQGYNLNNDDSGSYNNINDDLTGTGLPHPNALVTNATGDHVFQMPASYTTNDAIYISSTITNDTITLTTPAAFTGLSFLGAAGNGPMTVQLTVHHSGGADEHLNLTVPDWFNGSVSPVIDCNGRVAVDTAYFSNIKGADPRVFANDIALGDSTDPVTSIDILNTNLSSGRFSLFSVSGTTGVLPPIISAQPSSTNEYEQTVVSLSASATANGALTYQWQYQSNGVWVNLSNGGNIAGATTTTLTFAPLQLTNKGNYQLVATDSAGSAITGEAFVNVFTTNVDVTQPGDPITAVGCSPFGDGSPTYAIDDTINTKFGANITSGQVPGLVVTPAAGLTIISGIRLYTGSDTTGRDPTSFAIYGSVDGGNHYTLIASNAISLSDNRTLLAQQPPDPLSTTQYCTEVLFSNTVGFTSYKVLFPTEKGTGQVQFDEMELLGIKDTSGSFFSQEPVDAKAFNGNSVSFFAQAYFANNPTVSYAWYKDNNGALTPLSDGANLSGTHSDLLTINPATTSDVADYLAIATANSISITSAVVHLYIYSTLKDVTDDGVNVAAGFGDVTGTRYGNPDSAGNLFDNSSVIWQNGGSGQSASAGFPPFAETAGPVEALVTPTVGSTVVTGIRIYPGQDGDASDPASFILEGSNDSGGPNGTNIADMHFTTIASGPLDLPEDRLAIGAPIDPTQSPAQEILFNNTAGYTSYMLVFPTVRDPSSAAYLEVGEVELLGVTGGGVPTPSLSGITLTNGSIVLTGSGGTPNGTFSVLTNGNVAAPLTTWGTNMTGTFDANGNISITLPVSGSHPDLFYVIKTP